MEKLVPNAPTPLKFAGAVAGNVLLDPLNAVGFGPVKYATRTNKLLKGAKFSEEIGQAVAKAIIDTGVDTGRRSIKTVAKEIGEDALERTQRIAVNVEKGGVHGRVNVGTRPGLAATRAADAAMNSRSKMHTRLEGFIETYRRHIDQHVVNGGPKILGDPAIAAAKVLIL